MERKESASMDSQLNDKNRPEILQMMTTEHYNLQSGRRWPSPRPTAVQAFSSEPYLLA